MSERESRASGKRPYRKPCLRKGRKLTEVTCGTSSVVVSGSRRLNG